MSESWVVLKFGGTSVAGRPQWDTIAQLVRERQRAGHRVLVVCSALAGVTNALAAIAEAPNDSDARLEQVLSAHAELAGVLEIPSDDILVAGRQRLATACSALQTGPQAPAQAELLAVGEWLSTRLAQRFLDQAQDCEWVDARQALAARPEPDPDSRRAWLAARCDAFMNPKLQAQWGTGARVKVTQGFVASAPDGRTALLGRGGSDTSAALLASRLAAQRIEIWTDVNGLYSADPRLEPHARRITELSYPEALEMAAGGARVIHGRAIRAAAEAAIPIEIRNLSRPAEVGTRIAADAAAPGEGIRAVTSQPNMVVLLLENQDTRQQVGFLAGVFDAIARRGVSVDQVATSETTTTLAISRESNALDEQGIAGLARDLSRLARVEVFADCHCVNLVGPGARNALPRFGPTLGFFRERPLLMLSQSANDLSLSLLVRTEDAVELQRLLHRHLVADT